MIGSYWGPNGERLTFEQWVAMFESNDRHVARDEVTLPDGRLVLVSTVWLGIEHGVCGDLPLIFETMLFGPDSVEWQIRTSTLDEARAAHAQALQYVRSIATHGVARVIGGEVEQ